MSAGQAGLSEFRRLDDVQVFHVDLTCDAKREARAIRLLDSSERDRWHRFRYERPRREFALVRAALRSVLCSKLGCDAKRLQLQVTRHGKPFARVGGIRAPVSFNVSHSGKHGLIAVADRGMVGVDVEERIVRPHIDGIATLVFGPNELAELAAASGGTRTCLFYTLWTLKEALIKAVGTGFVMDTSQFEIPSVMRQGAPGCRYRLPQMADICWRIENLGNDHLAAAVAYECGAESDSSALKE